MNSRIITRIHTANLPNFCGAMVALARGRYPRDYSPPQLITACGRPGLSFSLLSKDQLCLLDFYNKHIIGRLSSAASSGLSPSISFIPGLSFRTIAQYRATLCFLIVKFTLGRFLDLLTFNGKIHCLVISILRQSDG